MNRPDSHSRNIFNSGKGGRSHPERRAAAMAPARWIFKCEWDIMLPFCRMKSRCLLKNSFPLPRFLPCRRPVFRGRSKQFRFSLQDAPEFAFRSKENIRQNRVEMASRTIAHDFRDSEQACRALWTARLGTPSDRPWFRAWRFAGWIFPSSFPAPVLPDRQHAAE